VPDPVVVGRVGDVAVGFVAGMAGAAFSGGETGAAGESTASRAFAVSRPHWPTSYFGGSAAPRAAPAFCKFHYDVNAGQRASVPIIVKADGTCGGSVTKGTIDLVASPKHGVLTIEGQRWLYKPVTGFKGPDAFTIVNRWPKTKKTSNQVTVTFNITVVD